MQSFLSATTPIREPEIMDDPALDGGRHAAALRGLSRLKYLSGNARPLWPPLAALALSGSDVVRVDGARSVRAALTIREATAMARAAGLKDEIVERRWPLRFLLSWRRS